MYEDMLGRGGVLSDSSRLIRRGDALLFSSNNRSSNYVMVIGLYARMDEAVASNDGTASFTLTVRHRRPNLLATVTEHHVRPVNFDLK